MPVQFKEALVFLGKTRAEALKYYEQLLETHVSQEIKEQTDVMHIKDLIIT